MRVFGTKQDKVILTIKEELLTLDIIRQVRNYLDYQEKEIKNKQKVKK